MFNVSNDYLTAVHSAVQSGFISGSVGGVPFGADDVLLGSASHSNQCVTPNNIKLGGVNVGTLKITFCNNILVHRGTWENKRIVVYWNQLIDDSVEPNVYETIPCGVFTVSKAEHAAEGVVVLAYDNMAKLDQELQFTTTDGAPYNIAKFLCNSCGVTLGMTREEVEALPNGTETFSLYPDNDCKTYRDVLSHLAVALGSFATMNRNGELIFKTFTDQVVATFNAFERIKGGSFSDFVSYFTEITVEDIASEVSYKEFLPGNNGLSMELGANAFMQYGLAETKRRIRLAVLGSLSQMRYTPFNTSLLGNPCFDLGDVIEFKGGIAGTSSKCCVMSFTYTFNRTFSVSGYGENPATLGAQSSTDKAVKGAKSNSSTNELTFLKYVNAEAVVPDEYGRRIVNGSGANYPLRYLLHTFTIDALKDTNVEVFARVQPYRMTTDGMYAWKTERFTVYHGFEYEVDGTKEHETTFKSETLVGSDWTTEHTLARRSESKDSIEDNFVLLNIPAGSRKTLNVYYIAHCDTWGFSGGDTFFQDYFYNVGDVEIVVKGQGLAKEERFSGLIVVTDTLPPYLIEGLSVADIVDNANVTITDNIVVDELNDELDEYSIAGLLVTDIDESLSITLTKITFGLITEDGEYNLVTEDGDYNFITD